MLPDRVSNPGPLTYESGSLPIALRGPIAQWLNLWPTDLAIQGFIPSRSRSLSNRKQGSIAHSLSLSFFLLKGRKVEVIHPPFFKIFKSIVRVICNYVIRGPRTL